MSQKRRTELQLLGVTNEQKESLSQENKRSTRTSSQDLESVDDNKHVDSAESASSNTSGDTVISNASKTDLNVSELQIAKAEIVALKLQVQNLEEDFDNKSKLTDSIHSQLLEDVESLTEERDSLSLDLSLKETDSQRKHAKSRRADELIHTLEDKISETSEKYRNLESEFSKFRLDKAAEVDTLHRAFFEKETRANELLVVLQEEIERKDASFSLRTDNLLKQLDAKSDRSQEIHLSYSNRLDANELLIAELQEQLKICKSNLDEKTFHFDHEVRQLNDQLEYQSQQFDFEADKFDAEIEKRDRRLQQNDNEITILTGRIQTLLPYSPNTTDLLKRDNSVYHTLNWTQNEEDFNEIINGHDHNLDNSIQDFLSPQRFPTPPENLYRNILPPLAQHLIPIEANLNPILIDHPPIIFVEPDPAKELAVVAPIAHEAEPAAAQVHYIAEALLQIAAPIALQLPIPVAVPVPNLPIPYFNFADEYFTDDVAVFAVPAPPLVPLAPPVPPLPAMAAHVDPDPVKHIPLFYGGKDERNTPQQHMLLLNDFFDTKRVLDYPTRYKRFAQSLRGKARDWFEVNKYHGRDHDAQNTPAQRLVEGPLAIINGINAAIYNLIKTAFLNHFSAFGAEITDRYTYWSKLKWNLKDPLEDFADKVRQLGTVLNKPDIEMAIAFRNALPAYISAQLMFEMEFENLVRKAKVAVTYYSDSLQAATNPTPATINLPTFSAQAATKKGCEVEDLKKALEGLQTNQQRSFESIVHALRGVNDASKEATRSRNRDQTSGQDRNRSNRDSRDSSRNYDRRDDRRDNRRDDRRDNRRDDRRDDRRDYRSPPRSSSRGRSDSPRGRTNSPGRNPGGCILHPNAPHATEECNILRQVCRNKFGTKIDEKRPSKSRESNSRYSSDDTFDNFASNAAYCEREHYSTEEFNKEVDYLQGQVDKDIDELDRLNYAEVP